MKVIKRDDSEQDFSVEKIKKAIKKANDNPSVPDNEKMDEVTIDKLVGEIVKKMAGFNSINASDIHGFIEKVLGNHKKSSILRAYIVAHDEKLRNKKYTSTEEKAISLRNGTSELRGDNANKHIDDNGSMRDYLAGLVCKSIAEKTLPKKITEAHNKGLIHYHDEDYSPFMPMHNCDVVNAEDMCNNTFMMGNTLIEPDNETPFDTACNLMAQINLQVSGRQYGGQTISWSHILPFIQQSRELIRKDVIEDFIEEGITLSEERINKKVEKKLRKEIYKGVKTYQYQVLCHSSSNGQTPFVSNNLCLREAETQQELDDFAILIEEIFKRRKKGVKDASGHYVSPLFPKLLYWTCDGLNVKEGDPYFYLTRLAAECEIKRTQPDIVSERETRRVKEGQIIPSMGCRSLLGPIWEETSYPVDEKFYWVKATGENRAYPYGTFVDKKDFSELENREYKIGYDEGEIAINFRGNTGWLMRKTDTEIVIWKPIVYGRFNQGVVTINLPHVALEARDNYTSKTNWPVKNDGTPYTIMDEFYKILDERLQLCREALWTRHESVASIKGKNSAILWMHGALARIGAEDTVGDYMKQHPKRASISLGFVGLYETCRALIGESNTTKDGRKLSLEILEYMNKKCAEWKEEDHLNYSIYGTPEESLTYKFAMANRRDFGLLPYITDKDYVVNSYHVDPRERVDAFEKLVIEGEYLALSSGGAVSYVETLDLSHNIDAVISIIQWMHEHIVYAEFNRKIGVCYECGYEGDIELIKTDDGQFKFRCPHCGNEDEAKMYVTGRLCGYLGQISAGNTNKGRLDDIYNRVIHLDCEDENVVKN